MKFQTHYRKDGKEESFITDGQSIAECKDKIFAEIQKHGISPSKIWTNQYPPLPSESFKDQKPVTEYDVEWS
jgi:hypothetical protein